ncbi:MAG: beta-ketoacyl-ACP synthase III [Acidimicrobiales bacterium]|nr:beta-ketoacyl-ACP synthase III [Acidimicrobiales bacterium]
MTVRAIGYGTSLPPKILTNDDLAEMMDTSDEWIRARAGIGARHVGGVTSEMATEAGAAALKDADLSPADIDLIVLCTSTPDQRLPATSAVVQANLGLTCGAFDVNAVCAGFTYGYVTAYGLMTAPTGPDRVLLIGADALSPIMDWTDRGTAILFGDGAAAVVLEKHEQGELLAFDFGADGNLQPILYCDHDGFITMEGREVFKKAVRAVTQSVENVLRKAELEPGEIDVVLPHQANIRIIEAVAQRIGIPMDRNVTVLETTGNTSGASIPLAMAKAADDGLLEPGKLVLMAGFGAGMAWASAVVRW